MIDVRVGSEVVCGDASDSEGLLTAGRIYLVSRVCGDLVGLEGVDSDLVWTMQRFIPVVRDEVNPKADGVEAVGVGERGGAPAGAPFAAGDEVRCVKSPRLSPLVKGHVYLVTSCSKHPSLDEWTIRLFGFGTWEFFVERFELVVETSEGERDPDELLVEHLADVLQSTVDRLERALSSAGIPIPA